MPRREKTETAVEQLTEKQAKADYARLGAEIAGHDRRYYQDDAPTISDAAYDVLRARYAAIEARFPRLRTAESLTQRVGVAPSARFAKVRHAVPMLSLDNAFSEEDVIDFVGRIRRFLRLADDEEIVFSASLSVAKPIVALIATTVIMAIASTMPPVAMEIAAAAPSSATGKEFN